MPLRDPFSLPLSARTSWEAIHGGWPMVIVQTLNRVLPAPYVAQPRVHLGRDFEVDIATWERTGSLSSWTDGTGGTALWAPNQPGLELDADLRDFDEYEVQIWDGENKLAAAIELISPRNKDRHTARMAFVSKCATLLREGVCVVLVDVVTIRPFNLFGELLGSIDAQPAPTSVAQAPLYAVTCRARRVGDVVKLDAWPCALAVGQPLPTLPLWLTERDAIPLDLETSYERTCHDLRIAG